MKRLAEIHIERYRGLRDLRLSELTDINVFLGPTNTGKSSVLEAVWLAATPDRPSVKTILQMRGAPGAASVLSLFPMLDPRIPISIRLRLCSAEGTEPDEGTLTVEMARTHHATYGESLLQQGWKPDETVFLEMGGERSTQGVQSSFRRQVAVRKSDMQVAPGFVLEGKPFSILDGQLSFFTPTELVLPATFDEAYSMAFVSGELSTLVDALRALHPAIEDISPVRRGDDPWVTYVRLAHTALPMMVMGDGFKASFVILAYATSQAVMLLDAPDAFQHRRGLEVLARSLVHAAASLGSQIILTTHSLEFLDLLISESTDKETSLQVYRFGLSDGRPTVYPPFARDEARESRELIGTDLRL